MKRPRVIGPGSRIIATTNKRGQMAASNSNVGNSRYRTEEMTCMIDGLHQGHMQRLKCFESSLKALLRRLSSRHRLVIYQSRES